MLEARVAKLIAESGRKVNPKMKVYDDTSAFMDIDSGDVVMLEETSYLISRNEIEIGFGMDGDPKYWVKRGFLLS